MSKPKVLVLKELPEEADRYIAEHCEILAVPTDRKPTRAEVLERLADVEGVLVTDVRVDAELLERAPKLKVASNVSVGYDNFDTEAMKARGVIGTHTPYVLDDTVADLVFALILSAARRVPELDRIVKEGRWDRDMAAAGGYFGLDVHHAVIGIIGMGRIGEAIARRAALGFGMTVLYHARSRKEKAEEAYGAQLRSLDELLRESDFVVQMTPSTPDTQRMIRMEHFEMMKRTAVFVNASRGQVVDEQALAAALEKRLIYAAGLDVYEREPVDPDNPLLKLPNVVTLPHIGSATAATRNLMALTAAKNLVAGVTGGKPPNVVPELR